MADQQNKWGKLTAMPSEYENDPEIAGSVIAEVQQNKAKSVKTAWMKRHWKKLVAVATSFVLAIGVGIGAYFALQTLQPPQVPDIVYYERETLVMEKIDDIDVYVVEQGIEVKYFDVEGTTTRCATVVETGAPAYLMQELLYVGSNGFDQINLKIVLLKNAIFDFEEGFIDLTDSMVVSNITVFYQVKHNTNNKQQIYAKMEYGGTAYYFEIVSSDDAKTVVEQYVTMLLA